MIEFLAFEIPIVGHLQALNAARGPAGVTRFKRAQTARLRPCSEATERLLEFLRSHLNPLFENSIMLVAFAPALNVAMVQQAHVLEEFERAHGATCFQSSVSRGDDSIAELVRW
ncbi:MAG TPA: hypothetical protein VEL06_13375 [Haliangiales bacterium]|nr:hypothetical protein [Haliangiales bacterium]